MAPAGIGGRVEGLHSVLAALASGRVRVLTVERSRRDLDQLVEKARAVGAKVRVVSDIRPIAETASPQGVVAQARPIPFATLESLTSRNKEAELPALVVLDHLEDPRNVGAIARSALGAGMTGLVIPSRRAAPITTAALKAAAGSFEHLPVATVSSVAALAKRVSKDGLWTIGLDPDAPTSLFGLEILAESIAIFVGAEGKGLGRLVKERLDLPVSIPMDHRAPSLNAGVAAALACFETQRIRSAQP
ncbi:MAG: RNA methyltransferase [Acidimicrobiia bacterium]|nr:RNA methyltransferase [Acidimicrobiia bacterium]MYF26745.1 RNA methyltransferase [Acidimicrobiia bacterium]